MKPLSRKLVSGPPASVLLGICSVTSTASAADDLSADLAAIATRHKIPGMVFAALRGDEIIGQGATGVRETGRPELITLNDKFHLGSDTKAMTATLLAQIVEAGKIKWTTTLGEAFGDVIPAMRSEWKPVTLQQVLAHRAGLPGNPGMILRAKLLLGKKTSTEQRRELLASILTDDPEYPPGSKYSYSNIGYILAGALLEKIESRSWEELMAERLFQPLGITSGGFGPPTSAAGKLEQPQGHHESGQSAPGGDNPAFYGPAGTAHMNIADWAKFISLHLRGDPASPKVSVLLLKPETFAALHAAPTEGNYSAGWIVTSRPWAKGSNPSGTGRTLTHSGSNTLWYCTAWIAPEIDFAFLIACNQGGAAATKACDEAAGVLIKQYVKPGSK